MLDGYIELSDLELVKRSVNGDESAFAEIVRRYSPRVFRFASRFFRQSSLVEEAAQEVFLKAFTQLKNFEGRGSLEGWLTRITTNTCLNLIRGTKNKPELTISDLTDDETQWLENNISAASNENYQSDEEKIIAVDLVNKVLETMSPDERLLLIMIDGEGASIKEVMELTGWGESKVKVGTFRARKKMREQMGRLLSGAEKKFVRTVKVRS